MCFGVDGPRIEGENSSLLAGTYILHINDAGELSSEVGAVVVDPESLDNTNTWLDRTDDACILALV